MSQLVQSVWTPLSLTPLLWLAVTLAAYTVGQRVQKFFRGAAVANPVLIAIALIVVLLVLSGTTYQTYFSGAQFIHLLLGSATVALGVPLARSISHVSRSIQGIVLALLAGSVTSAASGSVIVWLLGGRRDVALSIAPKAATTPIAMAISEAIGGIPTLTAAMAIAGGIVAAMMVRPLFFRINIHDWRAQGLAAGVSGSGVAAARIAPLDDVAAAFAAVGIGLNGLVTALLVPLMTHLWHIDR